MIAIDSFNPNNFELVGGPGCGDIFELEDSHAADVFEYAYTRTGRDKKVHEFTCSYEKGTGKDSHRAFYVKSS